VSCTMQMSKKSWCVVLFSLLLAVFSMAGVASAQAKLKEDTFKAAVNKYSQSGIENANNNTKFHTTTAAPTGYGDLRKSASSFTHWETWDFEKDGLNHEKAFSCSIHATFTGDSSKVRITLQRTGNWCPGFLLKATFYPKSNKLRP
jgi:hypothetical protein